MAEIDITMTDISGDADPKIVINAIAASDPATFDIGSVIDTVVDEIERGEIASAEDYIDDYVEHRLETTGRRPPSRVERDPFSSEKFRAWLPGEVERRAREALDRLLSCVSDGRIRAWRAVVADENWEPGRDRHIGLHWTFTESKAEPYDAEDGTHVHVVEAVIPETSIDWTETVIHHLTRDIDEDEITILNNAPVDVVNVVSDLYKRRTMDF